MKIVISPAKKMQTDGGFLPKSQPSSVTRLRSFGPICIP